MVMTISRQKLFLNGVVKREFGGKVVYTGYTNLGKHKGFINFKCWDNRHDLTKLKWLDRVTCDLKSYLDKNNVKRYEIVIIDYAEPKMGDWTVDATIPVKPKKQDPNEVPQEMLEPAEGVEENQTDINIAEMVDNYEKNKYGE